MMLPFLRKAALALLLPAAAACAPTPATRTAAPAAAKPAMWKLADADTTIYLFGTIHALPSGRTWRTAAFDRALGSADELVLEVADVSDMAATTTAMQKLGLSPGLPPIAERVPEAKRAALRAAMAESGIPEAVYDRLETWAAAIPILGVMIKKLGVDPALGVEQQIGAPFKAGTNKKVTGLETIEEQFGFFDTLSEVDQRAFLVSTLEDPAAARTQFQAMLDAWASGDVKGIERTFIEAEMTPALKAALFSKRNAKWADWLAKRLDRPGTVFVAVGAGHLAGKESVQAALKAKGFKSTRVQ